MIHQPSTQFEGTAADVDVQAREMLRLNSRLMQLLARDTGHTLESITHDINRDFWMNAREALGYGLIDKIVGDSTDTTPSAPAEPTAPSAPAEPTARK
jgi:ATP-dependent Clp protease protease subunit